MAITTSKINNLIYYSVLCYGLIVLTPFFFYIGIIPKSYNYFYLFSFSTILAGIAVVFSINNKKGIHFFIINIFLLLILFMAGNGVLNQTSMSKVLITEIVVYIRFYFFMVLGYQFIAFDKFKKAIIILLGVGFLANFVAVFTVSSFLRSDIQENNLAYRMQTILMPSALFLFFYDNLTKRERIIIILSFALYFIEQLLFQKRLPMARILITLMFFFYGSYLASRYKIFAKSVGKRTFSLVFSIALLAILLAISGNSLNTYSDALIARFFQHGTASETIQVDARWEIGRIFIEDISRTNDSFLGRGFGSVVYNPVFFSSLTEAEGGGYRSVADMGIPTMILKGGYLLVAYFSLILLIIIGKYKIAKTNSYLLGFWSVVVIWFLFSYAEGFLSGSFNEIVIAYSIGVVLSIKKTSRTQISYEKK